MTKTFSPALRLAAPLLALGLACTAFGTAHAAEPLLTPAGVQAAAGAASASAETTATSNFTS